MTIIAFDGRYVAADTLGIAGGYKIPREYQKLRHVGSYLFGKTGYIANFGALIDWYIIDNANPAKYPKLDDDDGNFIVWSPGQFFVFTQQVPYATDMGAPDAFGSGANYAIGAMKAGATVGRAAEIACECSASCGPPIVIFDLKKKCWVQNGENPNAV